MIDKIKVELDIIRKRYNIEAGDSEIVLEVLRAFNGERDTYLENLDMRILRSALLDMEIEKNNEKLRKIKKKEEQNKCFLQSISELQTEYSI